MHSCIARRTVVGLRSSGSIFALLEMSSVCLVNVNLDRCLDFDNALCDYPVLAIHTGCV